MPIAIDKPPIVLVDDQEISNFILRAMIASMMPAVAVKSFTDPLNALEYLRHHSPSLLFLDLNMPGLSGMELLESLEKEQKKPPTIILTSSISNQDKEDALKLGAVIDYKVKPISKAGLELVLTSHL